MKNLLYIHGYNGSPEGHSCSLIRRYFSGKGWNVIGMEYSQEDCGLALEQIDNTVKAKDIDLIIGSSLGGFLSILAKGVKRIAVNPCYHPSIELPKLGPWNGLPAPSSDMISSYERYEHLLKELSADEKQLITGYFATEDELLGDRYQKEFRDDFGNIHFIPGGHHLSEDAVHLIFDSLLNG